GEVGGDDGGAPFVPLGEQVEEEFASGAIQGDEAPFVDDQQVGALQPAEDAAKLGLALGFDKGANEIRSSPEADAMPLPRGFDAKGDGEVGLAGADGASQDDILGFAEPSGSGEVRDEGAVDAVGV